MVKMIQFNTITEEERLKRSNAFVAIHHAHRRGEMTTAEAVEQLIAAPFNMTPAKAAFILDPGPPQSVINQQSS